MAPTTTQSQNVIPFPVRNPNIPARHGDSLARDLDTGSQQQAVRIAAQVEREIARQASRMATGARASRVRRAVLIMPKHAVPVGSPGPGVFSRLRRSIERKFARTSSR